MPGERFRVELTRQAQKDLHDLRTTREEAVAVLLRLEEDPEAGGVLTGDLAEVRSLHWRAQRTDYRAAYVILEEERVCLVFHIGSRENFYREAGRRYGALQRALRTESAGEEAEQ